MKTQKQRILVVEDSPTQATKLRYLLEDRGHSVTAAGDAEEALQYLRQDAFALVLSDVLMPGINGFELCRRIKNDETLQDITVILVTALTNPEDVIDGLTCGADGFLTKPYSESFLLDKVRSLLDNRELQRIRPAGDGVEIFHGGRKYTIAAKRHHIVNLLLSTFENVMQKNRELEAVNRELLAMQRKLQIGEERLQQQAADLARSNRELESFSYSVSHDLRQPLRITKSFAEILLREVEQSVYDNAPTHLGRIIKSADKMNQLINDLLDLSRISRQEIAKTDTDLSGMAAGIVEELRTQQPGRVVDVSIQPAMRQQADATLLRQVLANLLSNAWKYTSHASRGEIVFRREEQDGRYVYSVSDNGAGFDERYSDRLFQPFSRLHSEEEFKGTGVGLAIVRRIIDRHDGEVWAQGTPGQGATFFFSLPRGK